VIFVLATGTMPVPVLVTALLAGAVSAASTSLTEQAVQALLASEWKGTPEEKETIEEKVKLRAVLGSSDEMNRTAYAESPILKHLKEFRQRGVANVAYVPPCMGKTTACHAIMKKYVKEGTNRGLCFSPNDSSRPYLEHMVTLLGFTNTESPPVGLVAGLLKALQVSRTGSQSFLILDDFMPYGPTNIDIELLLQIKKTVRSMNIVVVLLTANKDSADYMLTMNGLGSIVPLVEPYHAMRIIRTEFKRGNYGRGDESYHLDWETHLSMEWGAKEMKEAVLVDPFYQEKSDQEKQDLELKIDALLQTYTDEERKTVSPTVVLTALEFYSNTSIQLMQTLTSSQSGISSRGQETGLSCGGCHVM
jgi:hypothetical protein